MTEAEEDVFISAELARLEAKLKSIIKRLREAIDEEAGEQE